jgi:hypothetical protein
LVKTKWQGRSIAGFESRLMAHAIPPGLVRQPSTGSFLAV